MVLEVALIDVQPGAEEAFEAGYRQVRSALAGASGAGRVRMTRGVESPSRFVLMVEWDSVEAHLAFRESDGFAVWRGGIGPHFAHPPQVEHFADID